MLPELGPSGEYEEQVVNDDGGFLGESSPVGDSENSWARVVSKEVGTWEADGRLPRENGLA